MGKFSYQKKIFLPYSGDWFSENPWGGPPKPARDGNLWSPRDRLTKNTTTSPPMELVIFDLETTGFSPRTHEIIQIAAVRMRHGKVIAEESFATFVRPQNEIPVFISDLTGITAAEVRDAPEAAPALLAFSRFVGDATLVAHNGWRFDLGFIREGCKRHQLLMRAVPFFDSMTLSRQLWGGAESHSLDAVMQRLPLAESDQRRHDARGDVSILAAAVRTMWQRLGAPPDRCPVPLVTGHLPQ